MSEKETRTRRITEANDPAIKQVAKAEAENFSEPMSESCIKSSLSSPHFGLYVYEKGEKVVIVGPSGSGKSTFLRCLNLLEHPTEGQVIFEGTDLM